MTRRRGGRTPRPRPAGPSRRWRRRKAWESHERPPCRCRGFPDLRGRRTRCRRGWTTGTTPLSASSRGQRGGAQRPDERLLSQRPQLRTGPRARGESPPANPWASTDSRHRRHSQRPTRTSAYRSATWPVHAITGMCRVTRSSFSRRVASKPSRPTSSVSNRGWRGGCATASPGIAPRGQSVMDLDAGISRHTGCTCHVGPDCHDNKHASRGLTRPIWPAGVRGRSNGILSGHTDAAVRGVVH